MGEENRQNPFRNMNFKGKSRTVIPAFTDTWVREKILVRGARDGLTEELHLVTFMLNKTGCRPSEIINLRPEDIVLKTKDPHIAIRAREDRETKTETSIRKSRSSASRLRRRSAHRAVFRVMSTSLNPSRRR